MSYIKRAIVTGGTGFIGSWLIFELLKHNVKITLIIRDRNKLLREFINNSNILIIEKDLMNVQKNDFDGNGYDVFFHLAWSGVATEKKNDLEKQIQNIITSIHMLEIANEIKCKKFIAAGTVAEYVFCDYIMDVNSKQTPNDMYGAAKVSTHYFLDVRARQLKQPFNWVVIPSTYGERRVDNNIITYTIKKLLNGEKPSYGNLTQMWDFLYVEDVANAIYLIGEKGLDGKVYGIGSGIYRPLKDYIFEIRDIINPALELGIGEKPSMSEKSFSSCVNIDELVKDTGFKPKTAFNVGIRKTIEYLREKNE